MKTLDEIEVFLSPVWVFRKMSTSLVTVPILESEIIEERDAKEGYIRDNVLLEATVNKYKSDREYYTSLLKEKNIIISDQSADIIELESGNGFRYLIGFVGGLATGIVVCVLIN